MNPEYPSEIRGLFGRHGDSPSWLRATEKFPNGVPRFESREECVKFMKDYLMTHGGSNQDYPHLTHIFTTLVDWKQIKKYLLPAMHQARKEPSQATEIPRSYGDKADDTSENRYERSEARPVVEDIKQRLNAPFHRCVTEESVMNTLKYLFFHMRCGIYVMIRNGELRIFCPFVNKDYRNTWSENLHVQGGKKRQREEELPEDDNAAESSKESNKLVQATNQKLRKLENQKVLDSYYADKETEHNKEDIDYDISKWWANGNIICNVIPKKEEEDQFWGDHFLAPLRDMLVEACREREMPDCEFFLNKRDYPHLKVNVQRGVPVEPYGFIFDKDDRDPDQDVDLVEKRRYKSFAPIVSFYAAASDRFTDIPWPSSEDWEGACGLVFPQGFNRHKIEGGEFEMEGKPRDLFTEANFQKFKKPWEEKNVTKAFFRGSATGGGTTIETNQRLNLAHLCNKWAGEEKKKDLLDAQLTAWNGRDKKIAGQPMTFIRKSSFAFTAGKEHFTPIYDQSKYKYLVYADGHCAACRYGFMMRLGPVILKVLPRQVADHMWYFPLLKDKVDHVAVKADLSDLEEQLQWCRDNDDKCKGIGEKAKALYSKYVARDGLLDYVQMACRQMARCQKVSPYGPVPLESDPPMATVANNKMCFEDRKTGDSRHCKRCQEEVDEEEREKEEMEQVEVQKVATKQEKKKSLRDRMRRTAQENK